MSTKPSRIQVGFDAYTVTDRSLSPEAILDLANDLQFDGVQFLEPVALAPDLDTRRLETLADRARQFGLYLEVGLPSPNPVRRSRQLGRPVYPGEHVQFLAPHIEAVAALGCRHARAYVGDRHDRFRSDVSWNAQLHATEEVLRLVSPVLQANRVQIAIETHADLTSAELGRWLDAFPDEWFGVTLDTGNLLMRLDDPVEATRRLAPRVLATHVKDAVLAMTNRGLCWQARPLGDGIVPIEEIVSMLARQRPELALSIELHPRTYDLPVFDPAWLAHFSDLTPTGLARVFEYAGRCESSYLLGDRPRPASIEAIPWRDRDIPWLIRSRDYLRTLLSRGFGG